MKKQEFAEVWITAYALTYGIYHVKRARVCVTETIHVESGPFMIRGGYFHDKNWHRSETAAGKRAKVMLVAERKSLKKSLARLDKLENDGIRVISANAAKKKTQTKRKP